jgi:hypothetical protein
MFYLQYVSFKKNKHFIKQIKFGNLLFTLNILFALVVLFFIAFKITYQTALIGLLPLAISALYFNVKLLLVKKSLQDYIYFGVVVVLSILVFYNLF